MKKVVGICLILSLAGLAIGWIIWPDRATSPAPVNSAAAGQPKPIVTIGSKSLTEQYLFMKMTSILLRERGFDVNEMVFLDSPAIRSAMESGIVDLYWEYTTTARLYYHKKTPIYDPNEAFRKVAEEDRAKGIIWLSRSEFDSSWVLMMRADMAERLKIFTISDLSRYIRESGNRLKFATNEEYLHREDGMRRLEELYHFSLKKGQVIAVDSGLLSQAVKESRVQVAVGMASDPKIQEANLVALRDDQGAFLPYHASPVVLDKTLKKYPEIAAEIEKLRSIITQSNMLDLMYQVDILHKDVTKTARDFLIKQKIIQP